MITVVLADVGAIAILAVAISDDGVMNEVVMAHVGVIIEVVIMADVGVITVVVMADVGVIIEVVMAASPPSASPVPTIINVF